MKANNNNSEITVLGKENIDNLENVETWILNTDFDNAFEAMDEFIHFWLGVKQKDQVCRKEEIDSNNFKMDMGCFNDDGNVEIVCSILHK